MEKEEDKISAGVKNEKHRSALGTRNVTIPEF